MAHDLRSPVSRMKATLEQALGRTPDASRRRPRMASAIDEADGLHRLLDTALEISRAEAGIGRDRFTHASTLRPLLDDLTEVYGPLAEDRRVHRSRSMPLQRSEVVAHRELC
jgi:signal transduction histidine kinase